MKRVLVGIVTAMCFALAGDARADVTRDDRYLWTVDARTWQKGAFEAKVPRHFRTVRHSHRRVVVPKTKAPRVRVDPAAPPSTAVVERAAHAALVTVNTAAGIPIRVASSVAHKFEGFIADLVARGIRPTRIHCAASGGHVRHSLHYWGGACDFNGSASRFPPMNHHKVADLATKWGLRDGCSFRIRGGVPDCGHIDAGTPRRTRYASR